MAKSPEFQISAEIGKSETRDLATALTDTFSIITEPLGALGDQVRYYRSQSAIRNFEKAKKLADEVGIKLKAPPVRFLVPYIEYGSLNDDNNKTISDMWAKLLLSAGSNYSEKQIRYTRILSEMTENEAKLFYDLRSHKKDFVKRWWSHVGDASFMWDGTQIRPLLNSLHECDLVEEIFDSVIYHQNSPGSLVYELIVYDTRTQQQFDLSSDDYLGRKHDESVFSSLSTTNLIMHHKSFYVKTKFFEVSIFGSFVTQFGSQFFQSVHHHPADKPEP